MLTKFKIYKSFFFAILLLVVTLSCGGSDDDSFAEKIIPSNLTLELTLVGADANNPNGDGTGVIKCVSAATNAVKYEFRFGVGVEVENTTGSLEYTYTKKGINTITVEVYAYSETGDYINTSKSISVFVESKLVFNDEFDVDGSPDNSKWGYDIGTGNNGWGNGEKQYYTNRSENVIIEDGFLKITARKENYEGSQYTSTRMLTEGKFDFTYGKVEVRAKLPFGEGTWPAIWMLGSNLRTVSWPACGEIDIMEHWGHNQGSVQSATHTPSSYGNTINHGAQDLADVSTEFHVYTAEWNDQEIVFSVDDVVHYTYKPVVKNSETWPFTSDQFIILNVAMGGSWFTIDPDFEQSSMVIDYIRVYQ